jgi:PAS domain S-box-containing protein
MVMTKPGSKANAKHKNAAEELHESDDRFHVQADDVPVLIWGNGPDGCNFVNRAYLEFLGVSSQADVRHFDWARYIHPDDREAYLNEYLDCFRRRVTFSAVSRFQRHDGVYRWMKSVGHPRFNPAGVFQGYVGSTQDITEQKAMEDELRKARDTLEKTVEQQTAELRESKEHYRALVETSPDAIIVHKEGRFLYANQAALKLHGVDTLEQLKSRSILETIHPDDRELIAARMEQMSKGEIAPLREARLIRPNGHVVHFESTGTQINYGGDTAFQVIVRDITERKRAEDALRDNEKFLKKVFNCIQDGVSVLSKDLSVIRYNPTIEKWHGKDLLGKKCYRLFHGRDEPCETCPSVRAVREKTMQSEIVHDLIGWKEIYAYPLVGKDGKVTGTIEQVRDITESKRAEEALRESEEKYRFLVENADSIIIRWDTQGILTFFNEYAEKLFGYSKNEILGSNVVGTIVPRSDSNGRDLAAIMEDIERYPERYKSHVNENLCKNGERVWIDWTNKAIQDENGNVVEILSVGNDITKRKRIEEALRESEEMFRSLAESAKAGIILTRGDKFIYVNPETIKDLGYTEDELLSMNFWDVVHPDSQELVQSLALRMLQGLSVPSTIEIKVMTKAGETLWEELSPTLIDYKGEPTILATAFNITKRKRAEENLKSAKQQAELYLDLMGHDINNMHQIALGYLELAKDMPSGEVQAEFMDKSMGVLQRSTTLIGNVRKLQKLHDGLFQIQEVDVGRVLVDIQSEYAAVSGKTIILNMNEHDRCIVHANDLLHDVFSNLVNNAVKHTGDGTQIIVGLNVIGDNGRRYCRVTVEDNGPGIPDDYKERIFNRMHKGTARGMGLGLYLVRTLVDSYNGSVWAEDRVPGDHTKGARFVVMLPVA